MKKKLAFVIALTIIVLGSCKKSETPIANVFQILPLKIGYNWHYRTTINDTIVLNHDNLVEKDTTIGSNENWFILTYDQNTRMICKDRGDGLWFFITNPTFPQGAESLYYRYPSTENYRYQTVDGVVVTVASISTKVTVSAGTFHCYRYNTTYPSGEVYSEYFAPGVGMILLEKYDASKGSNNITERTELVSYSFN